MINSLLLMVGHRGRMGGKQDLLSRADGPNVADKVAN